ncbi:hypothetical protein [Nocardia vaccinii]|uniref:hypothetical protein n=1 Tax=Nocardia vaccinii TaxID=1822 RepID=UPI0008331CB6
MARDRRRRVQQIEKIVEDAGIKLSSVATDNHHIMGMSGRAMLEALIADDTDPAAMADLARCGCAARSPR